MGFGLYLSSIFLITFMGGTLPLMFSASRKALYPAVSLAAGLLVGTALFQLLPASMWIVGAKTGWPILAGFAIFYLPQKFILTHPCDEEDCDFHTLGILAFVGITLHAFVDGVGLGAVNDIPEMRPIVAAAVASHKIPAALALAILLKTAGIGNRSAVAYIALFAVATPLGALVTGQTLKSAETEWIGWALGFSTGNFLAIAGSDLLRRLHKKNNSGKFWRILLLFIGVAIGFFGGNLHLH
ncbi:MAG: hypothetical protein IEMM0002_0946 [bacterium]|nr:MAG: hypothetical protein IEMM0002_0946 [bacterium]